MKLVIDISNYDYDNDVAHPDWAYQFLDAGCEGIIVGTQWVSKAQAQCEQARDVGLPIVATYAEPDFHSAVRLAQDCGVRYVGLACEPGGITNATLLSAAVAYVKNAGLIPMIYGNAGDYDAIAGPAFDGELRWLAAYGANNPNSPKKPITGVAIHQYNSTIVIAGKPRDHNYWMIEEEDMGMTAEEAKRLATAEEQVYQLTQLVFGAPGKTADYDKTDYAQLKAQVANLQAPNLGQLYTDFAAILKNAAGAATQAGQVRAGK